VLAPGSGSRWAVVVSAAFLVASTTTADASRARLDAWGASWVAQGRLIAFTGVSSRDAYHSADSRLWMMNADGSRRRPLRGDVLSPSGRKLATAGDTGRVGIVGISSLSGRLIKKFTIHVVADLGYGPVAWAPDERAVTVGLDDARIFVADLRTGLVRSVSHIRSREDKSAAWSPDSRQIAFISCATDGSNCNLVLIARNGSGRRAVVRNISKADVANRGDGLTDEVEPVWAPNGRAIAFAVRFGNARLSKATRLRRVHWEQRYGIYVLKPDGSALRRIAATPYMDTDSDGPALAWSPNNRRIAFVDKRGITIADIGDGSRRRLKALPRNMGTDNYVSWAPSTRVLFSHRESLYTVLPGRRPLRILP
jgi:Tol biopolymer transport system component